MLMRSLACEIGWKRRVALARHCLVCWKADVIDSFHCSCRGMLASASVSGRIVAAILGRNLGKKLRRLRKRWSDLMVRVRSKCCTASTFFLQRADAVL